MISGLCKAGKDTRLTFSRDLDNLTLTNPKLNRYEKKAHDAADWLPDLNQCGFAQTVIRVKRKYDLTVDARERNALEQVLTGCPQENGE